MPLLPCLAQMHLGREITHGAPKARQGGVETVLSQASSLESANLHVSGLEGGSVRQAFLLHLAPFLPQLICPGRSFALSGALSLEQGVTFIDQASSASEGAVEWQLVLACWKVHVQGISALVQCSASLACVQIGW